MAGMRVGRFGRPGKLWWERVRRKLCDRGAADTLYAHGEQPLYYRRPGPPDSMGSVTQL